MHYQARSGNDRVPDEPVYCAVGVEQVVHHDERDALHLIRRRTIRVANRV